MSISRIYRLLRLITLLQGRRRYTVEDLVTELEVSRRTIFRDLNMLEMAHIPYYYDADKGGYQISSHFFLPPINLTITEALAMLVLTGRMRGAKNLPLLSHGTRAAVKLESALPKAIRDHVGSMIDRLSLTMGPMANHDGLDATFDRLTGAVARQCVCRLKYQSFYEGEQIATTVRPLRLVFVRRAWYLLAYSAMHEEIRTFKLSRIEKLTVTSRHFSTPKDVDLGEYFGQAWSMIPEGKLYDIHLHFSPKVAGNVAEVQWHSSQRVEWNDDGSAEYFVQVDGLGEIAWWVLGYGDQAEVIAPAALRKRVAAAAAAVVRKYRKEAN